MVLVLCLLPDDALYLYKVSKIVSKISKKCFRVIEGLIFSFSGFSKGHNSVKM